MVADAAGQLDEVAVERVARFRDDDPVAAVDHVAAEWARLLRACGSAMVHLRSRRGFLARLREDDELIKAVRETWERPIRGVMRHLGVPDEHFDHALFPYNMMFDPREILDLTSTGLAETTRSIG